MLCITAKTFCCRNTTLPLSQSFSRMMSESCMGTRSLQRMWLTADGWSTPSLPMSWRAPLRPPVALMTRLSNPLGSQPAASAPRCPSQRRPSSHSLASQGPHRPSGLGRPVCRAALRTRRPSPVLTVFGFHLLSLPLPICAGISNAQIYRKHVFQHFSSNLDIAAVG